MSKMKFMSIELDNLTMKECITAMDDLIQKNRNSYVVTPNVDHMVQLEHDTELKECYENASLVLTDGKPLIWISQLYKQPIKEKISGSDIFPELCALAGEKGYTMFFLGAAEGVAAKAAVNLKKKYPKLQVVGTYSPEYGFEKDNEKVQKVVSIVKQAKPDILIVALGAPKQEKFIYHNRKELNVPLSLGLGASLYFEAGNVKRAPRWMSNCGLEWLYRIIQEPKRMFKRYFVDAVKIVPMIWKYRKEDI